MAKEDEKEGIAVERKQGGREKDEKKGVKKEEEERGRGKVAADIQRVLKKVKKMELKGK